MTPAEVDAMPATRAARLREVTAAVDEGRRRAEDKQAKAAQRQQGRSRTR